MTPLGSVLDTITPFLGNGISRFVGTGLIMLCSINKKEFANIVTHLHNKMTRKLL
jgi:hypothetical protein